MADREWRQLGSLTLGTGLERVPDQGLVVMGGLPVLVPLMEPMSHSVGHWDIAVWPLPSYLTCFEVPEKPSKAFGFALSDPGSVLKLTLSSGLLKGLGELMLDGVLHELQRAGILVVVPVLCHVQKLGPRWFSHPVLGRRFGCFDETIDGAMGWVFVMLDVVQTYLELFPIGWLPFFPYWTCFGRCEGFVLRLEVGGAPLRCPGVLL